MKTSLLILTCLALLPGTGKAATNNPNTDWFSQAKYGVFIHFLPSGKTGLRQVEQFDVKALAGQLEEMGAGYLVLTLGQNSGFMNSPNAAYEKRTGYLGENWGRRNTRFTDDQWVDWARKVTDQHGVVTLDAGPNHDATKGPVGSLAEAQVKQVQAIRAALRPGASAAGGPCSPKAKH